MAKVKFDVSGSDAEKALGRIFVPPRPGNYKAKLIQCQPGFKMKDGTPDKEQPRLEIVYEITDPKVTPKEAIGARLYEYIGFTEAQAWKMDQFLQAFGVANKKKRKGTFDTDVILGMPCMIRVKAGTSGTGEDAVYRAEPGGVAPAKEEDIEDEEDEEEEETEEETEEEEEEEDEEEEEEEDEEAEDEAYTEEDLAELDLKGLSEIMTTLGHGDPKTIKGKPAKIKWILEAQSEEDEEEEDEATDYSTWALPALRKEAEDRELDSTGKKAALIARLQADDSAEEPF